MSDLPKDVDWVQLFERLNHLEYTRESHTKSLEKLCSKMDEVVKSVHEEREARIQVEKTYLKVIAGVLLMAVFNQIWQHIASVVSGV